MKFIIPIDVYDTDVLVYFGKPKEFLMYIKPKIDKETFREIKKAIFTSNGFAVESKTRQNILFMPATPKTVRQYATLAHEIFHTATTILSARDIPLDRNTEECYAYLISWITNCIYRAINEKIK